MKKLFCLPILPAVFLCCSAPDQHIKESDYERIVVLGQSAIDLLLELDLQDKIAGIAYFDSADNSLKYTHLPVLSTNWADKESILALQPDLIFAMEAAFRADRIGNRDFWHKRGIKTFIVDNYKRDKCFDTYYTEIDETGQLFGIRHKTDSLLMQLKETRQHYSTYPDVPVRILHLSYAGSGQFYYYPPSMCLLDEITEQCGGSYIYLGETAFILSAEAILQTQPDKIIFTQFRKHPDSDIAHQLAEHPVLRHLEAIKTRQTIEVDYTQAIRGASCMQSIYSDIHQFLNQ